MIIYYSKTTRGFYDSEMHRGLLPEDCVEVSQMDHNRLMDGQSRGLVIEADETGFPVLKEVSELSEDTQIQSHNTVILAKIQEIERELQPRAIRDMLLYNDNTRLKALDDQIVELRSRLK